MAGRVSKRLTAVAVRNQTRAGLHADGDGLYLRVSDAGAKSWVFIFQWQKSRKEMGIGALGDVGLADARELVADLRKLVRAGRNPIIERKLGGVKRSAMPSFKVFADQYIARMEPQWKNPKHIAQWKMTLNVYAKPIHDKPVGEVTTEDVFAILLPEWTRVSETASRLRGRIEKILDAAKTAGYREGDNPARWGGHLEHLLPKRHILTRGHHAAMPFHEVPAFVQALRGREASTARALEFHILCASRPGMVEGMHKDEVDWRSSVWVVPRERMKLSRDLRIPLSSRAMAILKVQWPFIRNGVVFHTLRPGNKMSNNALRALMQRMDKGHFTPHGFRSSFKDWSGDETEHDDEASEIALAHSVGSSTKRAYRRSDALKKRRELMEDWSDYLNSTPDLKLDVFRPVKVRA